MGLFSGTTDGRSGGGTSSGALDTIAQCRLFGFAQNDLRLQPFNGEQIAVGGEVIYLPAAGLSCLYTATRINGQGNDTGNAPTPGQFLHAYVSNTRASFAPRELRLSLSAPVATNVAQPGVLYLGTTENAANWRYVGAVQMSPTGFFQDNFTGRLVASYFNRQRRALFVCPGFDDAGAVYGASPAATWQPLHAAASLAWVQFSDDVVRVSAHVQPNDAPSGFTDAQYALTDAVGSVRAAVLAGGGFMQFDDFAATGARSCSLVYVNNLLSDVDIRASLAPAGGEDDSAPATYLCASVLS